MGTLYHIKACIKELLSMSDEELGSVCGMDGVQARMELTERFKQGELYIGSEGCDSFDPKKGCPGHPTPEKEHHLVDKLGESEQPLIVRAEQNLLN